MQSASDLLIPNRDLLPQDVRAALPPVSSDSQFLLEVSRHCSDEDKPAWADRLEHISNRLYTLEREEEKERAKARLARSCTGSVG